MHHPEDRQGHHQGEKKRRRSSHLPVIELAMANATAQASQHEELLRQDSRQERAASDQQEMGQ